MEQEEAGPDNNEPHPPNNNNTSYVSENYHFLHTKLFSPPPSFPLSLPSLFRMMKHSILLYSSMNEPDY